MSARDLPEIAITRGARGLARQPADDVAAGQAGQAQIHEHDVARCGRAGAQEGFPVRVGAGGEAEGGHELDERVRERPS